MLKKIIMMLAVAATIAPAAFAQAKFGVIAPETIMRDMPEMLSAQKELDAVSRKYQREDSVLQAEIQVKYDDLQKLSSDSNTPDAIKERRMQELQDMSNKYQQFRANAQQDLQRQQEVLLGPVQQKLINAIEAVGKAGNYTFILTREVPAFVGSDVVDVTPDVRKQLGLK